MAFPELQRLSSDLQQQVLRAEAKVEAAVNTTSYYEDLEAYADILEEVGLHEEGRKRYNQILSIATERLWIARIHRKMCFSFTNQRDYLNAERSAEAAIQVFKDHPPVTSMETNEYFNVLIEASLTFYFRSKAEQLTECIVGLKKLIAYTKEKSQQLRFFYSVSMDLFLRYRWYMLPEEAVSHCQFYVHLATETSNPVTIAIAKASLGFVHLWREEISLSRSLFTEAIALLNDKNYGYLLMCYNYIALGYRMQNNLSMTEKWTTLTFQKASQTNNQMYIGMSHGNVAWLNAKRKNWLYAEDNARKGFEMLRRMQPLHYTCSFPLIESLVLKNNLEEAGQYVYFMLSPKSKRLPPTVTSLLVNASNAWVQGSPDLKPLLDDLLAEAKTTGYY